MPITVLVVDDSVLMRAKITELIEKDGDIEVVGSASNGIDALEKIPRLAPDVVTLDVQMPRLDGISTLKRIMAECPSRVIMLTGHATTQSAIEGMKRGALDYLMKPCDLEVLVGKVREAARRKREHQERILQAEAEMIALRRGD